MRIAEHRQQVLDSAEPAQELSSDEASKRRTSPLFSTLALMGRSILARMQGDRAVRKSAADRARPKP